MSATSVERVFPSATPLQEYVLKLTGIYVAGDTSFNAFLGKTLVVPESTTIDNIEVTKSPEKVSFKDVLARFISTSLENNRSYKNQNVLCLGYRFKSMYGSSAALRYNSNVECVFINTVHSQICTSHWQQLLDVIGELAMRRIMNRPVFAYVDNGSYLQICGDLTFNYIVSLHDDLRSKKSGPSLVTTHGKGLVIIRPTLDIPRYQIFYNYRYQRRPGLPYHHLLNKAKITGSALRTVIFTQYSNVVFSEVDKTRIDACFNNVINAFRCCDVALLLFLHCCSPSAHAVAAVFPHIPPPSAAVRMASARAGSTMSTSTITSKTSLEIRTFGSPNIDKCSAGDNSRKRRGCRAGRKVRARNERSHPNIIPSPSAPSACQDAFGNRPSEQLGCKAATGHAVTSDAFTDGGLIAVGERLRRRLIRTMGLAVHNATQGFASQPAHVPDHVSASDVQIEVEVPIQSPPSSDAQVSSLESDCGNQHHLLSRRLLTQVSLSGSVVPASTCSSQETRECAVVKDDSACISRKRPHARAAFVMSSSSSSIGKRNSIRRSLTQLTEVGGRSSSFETAKKRSHVVPISLSPENEGNFALSTSIDGIAAFVKAVCRRTFSVRDVWGSRHNLNAFMRSVDTYVRLARSETMNLTQLSRGLSCSVMPWLMSDRNASGSPIDPLGLLRAFLYWVFTDFINPLLSANFYCTEAEGCGSSVLFFRKPVWSRLMRQGRAQMQKNFVEVDLSSCPGATKSIWTKNASRSSKAHSAQTKAALRALPTVRFVPKMHSMRAITNLKSKLAINAAGSKAWNGEEPAITNANLYNCLHVLKNMYMTHPHLLGFGSFGVEDIYKKFAAYRSKQHSMERSGPCAYFIASLDLEKCYDNVDTRKLYDLIRDLLSTHGFGKEAVAASASFTGIVNVLQEERKAGVRHGGKGHKEDDEEDSDDEEGVLLHKYHVSHYIKSMERTVTRTVRHVAAAGDFVAIKEAASEIAKRYPNTLITDAVVYPKLTLREVLKLLKSHLFSHVVKLPVSALDPLPKDAIPSNATSRSHGFVPYTQITGIPQGSVLSPSLCNLYYGHAERLTFGSEEEQKKLCLADKSVIIRLMDDYIIVSTEKQAVQHFLQRIHVAFQAFGGGINAVKTKVNFDSEIQVDGQVITLQKVTGRDLAWCGLLIDTETLEVRPGLDRLLGKALRMSLSLDCSRLGIGVRRAMKSFIRMKIHAIVLDAALNTPRTVICTVFRMFLLAAMRSHSYVKAARSVAGLRAGYCPSNPATARFLCRCIDEAILFGAHLLKTRTLKRNTDRGLRIGLAGSKGGRPSVDRHPRMGAAADSVSSSQLRPVAACTFHRETASASHFSHDLHMRKRIKLSAANNIVPAVITEESDGCQCVVYREHAIWLGYMAFIRALGRRPGTYFSILPHLRERQRATGLHMSKGDRLLCERWIEEENADRIMWESKAWL